LSGQVRELQWLPVAATIQYKLCLLVHKTTLGVTRVRLHRRPADVCTLQHGRHYERHVAAISTFHGHVDVSATEPSAFSVAGLPCKLPPSIRDKQLPAHSLSIEIYSDITQFPCDSTALLVERSGRRVTMDFFIRGNFYRV